MMWNYGMLVPEVTALHRAVRGTDNQLDCITSTLSPCDIPTTVRAHVHASTTTSPQHNQPITWRSPVLVDMHTQRNHKFKLKRQFLEMHGQVLYLGKHPTSMQVLLHLDDVTAVEPSCLEPHSLLVVTASTYILVALADEREYTRWKALLRHARPLGYDGTLQIKAHDDVPTVDTTLRTDWSVAECMAHVGLDEDKFCIHVNGTSQFWTDPSACLEDFAPSGKSLQLTAVSYPAPQISTSSRSMCNALNVRFHKICHVFQHVVDVKGGHRHLTERLDSTACVLRLEVVEGSHVHCAVDTAPFLLMPDNSRHLDNVWYTLWNVPAASLTSSWRLMCTVFAVTNQPEEDGQGNDDASTTWTKLATTGMQLRHVDGDVVDGHTHLQLLDSTADLLHGPLPLGVVHGAPFVHWQDLDFTRRPSQQLAALSDSTIMKQGLVHVLQSSSGGGRLGSGKLWSHWVSKWCVLTSHGHIVLRPVDHTDPGPGTTKLMSFSLTDATSFHVTDKLNATSRRSSNAGSKSTQKVHTTHAFTIDVDAATTLVLGVATRNGRDDWLHTLRVATSSVAARKSIDWSFRGTSLSDDTTTSADDHVSSIITNHHWLQWLLERMAQDPLFALSSYQRSLLWQFRQSLPKTFALLPRLLTCREWRQPIHHDELVSLLDTTLPPAHPTEYLSLLGRPLAHLTIVREFAIDKLDAALDDDMLATVLPQLGTLDCHPMRI
ncbi:hypothetical protein DYB30_011218 [Aphanomyces astaci]|uniref:PH domain-containing protein n=1 Tax=Aphanomyces astaci TaxID=112090 RepID=A0A397DDV5_APHAT|nr:hypothetical protein DYB30_011218 [Aphanomyces astaci]